jgi:hypothetical protein
MIQEETEMREVPEGASPPSGHDRPAEPKPVKEPAHPTIERRSRSRAEQRRLQALQHIKSIKLKNINAERTALQYAILLGTKSPLEELEPVASNIEPNSILARFRRLGRVDRSLFLRAAEKTIVMIEDIKQQMCEAKYGLTLKELQEQLHNEAAKQVLEKSPTSRSDPPVSEGPVKGDSAEARSPVREVSDVS